MVLQVGLGISIITPGRAIASPAAVELKHTCVPSPPNLYAPGLMQEL